MCTLLRNLGIPVVAFVLLGLSAVGVSGQDAPGTVTITQGGTGQGTVTSSPEGINCTLGFGDPTGPCEATFPAGTRVKLKAVAADSSKFVGWAPVNSCPKPKSFRIEAGDLVECQPVFEFNESPTFLLQVPIEGAGTVTSEPAGINCTRLADGTFTDTACAVNFTNGITVTLTATAADGWAFQGFSGDEDCIDGEVVMDALTRCAATFVQRERRGADGRAWRSVCVTRRTTYRPPVPARAQTTTAGETSDLGEE